MITEGMFCWEEDHVGCICGNDCEPPNSVKEIGNENVSS